MKTNRNAKPTTEAPQNEAQAQVHPANPDGEKNRKAYWAAYRRALSGSPLLVYPNRADALLKGYADGLKERRARRAAVKQDVAAETLAEAVTLADGLCAVCHSVSVNPADGFDTCPDCAARI